MNETTYKTTTSTYVARDQVDRIISDPEFPQLVSFPRTGSHWLRMLMELYFECPSLVRIFYYHDAKEFTCYHRHDQQLQLTGVRNVIYLYRDPVNTLYSQMNYHRERLDDEKRIQHWAELYAAHLTKWLLDESFTRKKTILSYEGLQNDLHTEFRKLCVFFDSEFCPNMLDQAAAKVTKQELKIKTSHDLQVVNLTTEYPDERLRFQQDHGALIQDLVFGMHHGLERFKSPSRQSEQSSTQ